MKSLLPLTFCLFFAVNTEAKKKEKYEIFSLTPPQSSYQSDRYTSIILLDNRDDTGSYGIWSGVGNSEPYPIRLTPSFNTLLQDLRATQPLPSGGPQNFVINLRIMKFSLVNGFAQASSYLRFVANYYAETEGKYYPLGKTDTTFIIKKIRNSALKATETQMADSIYTVLELFLKSSPAADVSPIPYQWVLKTDSIEKRSVPAYANATFRNGIYKSFKDFLQQTPADSVIDGEEEYKQEKKQGYNRLKSFRYWDAEKGKSRIGDRYNPFYMVVAKGQPYILHLGEYEPVTRRNGDFYFIGNMDDNNNMSMTMAIPFGLAGAVAGAIVDNARNKGLHEWRMDYLTGMPVPIRKLYR